MRCYPVCLLAFGAVAIAACGEAAAPVVAGLGGSTTAGSTTALSITPNQVQLVVGASRQLVTNAPASLQNQVEWTSLQSSVAAMSPSGMVTAIAPGSATIVARISSDTTKVATATVVVVSATGTP